MSPQNTRATLLQGSLDMLILRTLLAGPHHGYAIAQHLHRVSDALLQVEEGSLYPALHRLERQGWVASEWGKSEANRRARYYRLTAKGRKHLQAEVEAWTRMSQAIDRVLHYRPAEACRPSSGTTSTRECRTTKRGATRRTASAPSGATPMIAAGSSAPPGRRRSGS